MRKWCGNNGEEKGGQKEYSNLVFLISGKGLSNGWLRRPTMTTHDVSQLHKLSPIYYCLVYFEKKLKKTFLKKVEPQDLFPVPIGFYLYLWYLCCCPSSTPHYSSTSSHHLISWPTPSTRSHKYLPKDVFRLLRTKWSPIESLLTRGGHRIFKAREHGTAEDSWSYN